MLTNPQFLFKVLGAVFGLLTLIFIIAVQLNRTYGRLSGPVRKTLLILLHVLTSFILVIGFYAMEHVHGVYAPAHRLRVEVIECAITLVFFLILGVPFVFFYIKTKNMIEFLKKEREVHKLDVLNLLNRLWEEMEEGEREHARRTSLWSKDFCEFMKIEKKLLREIIFAAMFHNIGKLFIRRHTDAGSEDLTELHVNKSAALLWRIHIYEHAADIVRHHHERWDGQGHPNRLKGMDIPFGSRVIAIVGRYERLVNGRMGTPKLSPDEALVQVISGAGTEFDPDMIRQFSAFMNSRLERKS